uniref:Uncharacterized protein n=1 Tax=Knipowitschia caucasica TaxID=637954 RepID=A0AAV2L709_KNICA
MERRTGEQERLRRGMHETPASKVPRRVKPGPTVCDAWPPSRRDEALWHNGDVLGNLSFIPLTVFSTTYIINCTNGFPV